MFFSLSSSVNSRRVASPHLLVCKRAALLLWTLFLLVAQNWHICELSGANPHFAHKPSQLAKIWKPKCGGGKLCPCEVPEGAVTSPTGKLLSDAPDAHSHRTCLARLLMGMASDTPSPWTFATFRVQRRTFAPQVFEAQSVRRLSLPPSRGPPIVLL